MFDGSGSWGTGVEAASWFRDWFADNGDVESKDAITTSLRTAAGQLPPSITDNDFHWTFSILVAIVTAGAVQIGACGGFAAVMRSSTNLVPLFTPTRLIDKLVAHGHVSEVEAEDHKYANLLCGPFFGVEDQDDLIWMDPKRLGPNSQVLIAGPALPRFLASDTSQIGDPQSLHDAVEAFAGLSTPTAIITSTESG